MKMKLSIRFWTFILDPLTAKNLRDKEGFKTKEDFREWFSEQVKVENKGPFPPMPFQLNLIVVGDEWNPMYTTADFFHTRTVSIDKWIPRGGPRTDKNPVRIPHSAVCKDGTCGIV